MINNIIYYIFITFVVILNCWCVYGVPRLPLSASWDWLQPLWPWWGSAVKERWMDIYSNCESTFFSFFFQQYNAVKSRSSAIFCVAIQTVKKDISSVWSGGLCCSVRDRCPDLLPQSLCLGTMTMSHYFPPLILRDIMCMTTRGHFTEESGSFWRLLVFSFYFKAPQVHFHLSQDFRMLT